MSDIMIELLEKSRIQPNQEEYSIVADNIIRMILDEDPELGKIMKTVDVTKLPEDYIIALVMLPGALKKPAPAEYAYFRIRCDIETTRRTGCKDALSSFEKFFNG